MKNALAILALILATSFAAVAQEAQTSSSETEQELRAITQELWDAAVKEDSSVAARVLADTFIATDENGSVSTKDGIIKDYHASTQVKSKTFEILDFKVVDYGDVAVVSYRAATHEERHVKNRDSQYRVTGAFHTRMDDNQYRHTETYIRKDGRWRMIASHFSGIPRG